MRRIPDVLENEDVAEHHVALGGGAGRGTMTGGGRLGGRYGTDEADARRGGFDGRAQHDVGAQ
jgi:hypothetical protein